MSYILCAECEIRISHGDGMMIIVLWHVTSCNLWNIGFDFYDVYASSIFNVPWRHIQITTLRTFFFFFNGDKPLDISFTGQKKTDLQETLSILFADELP